MVLEKFHGSSLKSNRSSAWTTSVNPTHQDGSLLTKQFQCLKSKRKDRGFGYSSSAGGGFGTGGGSMFKASNEEKSDNFSKFSVVWIILPVINLCVDIAMEFVNIIMFFVKIIFDKTYDMIVPTFFDFMGRESGFKGGKKYCITYSWFRYVILALCPPAGVFMAYGLKGWLQIIICCMATLFYYFPGLAYALIVINRSDVSDYMKRKKEPSGCDDDGGLLGNFFISDGDNKPTCAMDLGEPCSVDSKPLSTDPSKLDCCANPELIDGQWMRLGKPAVDSDDQPITKFSQGETYCRNDTKTKGLKQSKGLCVWKSTNKPN